MPELPEVENVRLTLARHIAGQAVQAVTLHRADIVTGQRDAAALLVGSSIAEVIRQGKQLALVSEAGRCVCVHLGMTGSLRFTPAASDKPVVDTLDCQPPGKPRDHIHVTWKLPAGTLHFRDPRRFGGIWTFGDLDTLHSQKWNALGPDALKVGPAALHGKLTCTQRPLKAVLLDQSVLAGLGNIYVDELLYKACLSPLMPACLLTRPQAAGLVRRMRTLLHHAIEAGGSTLRDYVDTDGQTGGYQNHHHVYGRANKPCKRCKTKLMAETVAGRTTVFCPQCQPIQVIGR